ncbi:MAG: hypothetical protein ACLU9S_08165 [Oscillospiraceae bacterium]
MTKLLQSHQGRLLHLGRIIEETPAFGFKAKDIDTLRETVNAAQYRQSEQGFDRLLLVWRFRRRKDTRHIQRTPRHRHLPHHRLRWQKRRPF